MKTDTTPKSTAAERDHLRVQAQRWRRHYGVRPSHMGKPVEYYRRADVLKKLRVRHVAT